MPARLTRPFLQAVIQAGGDPRDPDLALRVEVQVMYGLLAGFSSLVYAYTQLQFGTLLLAILFLLGAAGLGALLVALRWFGRLRPVTHGTQALVIGTVSLATYWTGGLRLTNACPFFIPIVASFFLLGHGGWPWAACAVLIPVGFQLAGDAGVVFPDHVPVAGRATDAFITWITAIVVITLFAAYYEAARAAALARRVEAEAARSQFLANVSHELRTPLHAIKGMTRQALDSKLSEPVRDALETVKQGADELHGLIDDLLLLASIERDHFELTAHDFDPVEEIERVATLLRFRCGQQGLRLEVEIDPATPRWARGDGARLRQVLSNLGSNAVKFTERGTVSLRSTRVETGDGRLGIRFVVSDTGVGIRPEDRELIFQPFVQAQAAKERAQRGVGLGLHIVREIVQAMGGRLELESTPGQGSRFEVTIPFEPARSPRPESIPSSTAGKRLRVLVADDDPVNVRMATLMLEELGYEVSVAHDGREAVASWVAECPDAILMDIQMPELDGEQAMGLIRGQERDEQRAPVPIIALTGYGTPEHRARYLAAGASSCLFKPFGFEELSKAIETALSAASR